MLCWTNGVFLHCIVMPAHYGLSLESIDKTLKGHSMRPDIIIEKSHGTVIHNIYTFINDKTR